MGTENVERDQLDQLIELNETISKKMILKEKLKRIWSYIYKGWAEKRIDEWIEMAETVDSQPVQNFARRLDVYRKGILNHCDHKLDISKLEGINNKIKYCSDEASTFILHSTVSQ